MKHKLSDETAHMIVSGAVTVEQEFICDALPCHLIGMNSTQMIQYIQFVADRLLTALGHPTLYHVGNPFDWMELISLQGKTNFLEARRRVPEEGGDGLPRQRRQRGVGVRAGRGLLSGGS